MKKLFSVLAIVALLLSCSVSFASVGVNLNGSPNGAATDINVVCGTGTLSTPLQGSVLNVTCSPNLATAGIANGGATSMVTSDTVVPTSYAFVRKAINLASGGVAQTGTLANGIPGQILTMFITTVGASGQFTVTPATSTGFTSIKFTAAKDEAIFLYVNDTVGWVLLSYDGSVTVNIP